VSAGTAVQPYIRRTVRPLATHLNPPGWLARLYSIREDTAVVWVRSRFFSLSASFQL
jgi:hypothetical protein